MTAVARLPIAPPVSLDAKARFSLELLSMPPAQEATMHGAHNGVVYCESHYSPANPGPWPKYKVIQDVFSEIDSNWWVSWNSARDEAHNRLWLAGEMLKTGSTKTLTDGNLFWADIRSMIAYIDLTDGSYHRHGLAHTSDCNEIMGVCLDLAGGYIWLGERGKSGGFYGEAGASLWPTGRGLWRVPLSAIETIDDSNAATMDDAWRVYTEADVNAGQINSIGVWLDRVYWCESGNILSAPKAGPFNAPVTEVAGGANFLYTDPNTGRLHVPYANGFPGTQGLKTIKADGSGWDTKIIAGSFGGSGMHIRADGKMIFPGWPTANGDFILQIYDPVLDTINVCHPHSFTGIYGVNGVFAEDGDDLYFAVAHQIYKLTENF